MAGERRRHTQMALLVILSAALTASFRFLGTPEFNNDHFVHLAAAQQVLFGEWPTRDFIDIGRPLQIVASAAAQRVIGHNLFAEALLVSAAFGIAAAFTAAVVFRVTGSALLAAGAVIVEIAAFPRTYSYPKLLAIAAGLWLIGCFLRRPGVLRRIMMAAGVAIAFLSDTTSACSWESADWWPASWRCRKCLAGTMPSAVTSPASCSPWWRPTPLRAGERRTLELSTALEQNQSEAGYVWPNPFAEGDAWGAQLLYAIPSSACGRAGVCAMSGNAQGTTGAARS